MVDAVAVDAHVVHHVDEDDALLPVEVIHHRLGRCSHALKETVLVTDVLRGPKLGHVELFHLSR